MAGFQCPFCYHFMVDNNQTHSRHLINFNSGSIAFSATGHYNKLIMDFYKCPHCDKQTITAYGVDSDVEGIVVPIYPNSLATQFPEYIPISIRKDYEEACAIVNLSPKASATLSRRCLQSMIRDYWEVKGKTLKDEIDAIQNKVAPAQWKVIDGVRRIGNIGAHMEKDINLIVDIEPEEAQKLIKLIELLMEDWYVRRHEQELLYEDIIEMDVEKQVLRKA